MNSFDTYVIFRIVNRHGNEVGTEERFYKTFKATDATEAHELACATGHRNVVVKRTPLLRVLKLWLTDKTYKYWPNQPFAVEFYYLATGMEGIADERSLGVVYARCKAEAERFATRDYMKKLSTETDYRWYSSCITAKPVLRIRR